MMERMETLMKSSFDHSYFDSDAARTAFQTALLDWYDRQGRDLPWRYKGGEKPDPYRVWLSEVMLQQTTIATVKDYFERFTAKWPSLKAFTTADEDEVLALWSGLGYYSRARNLYKAGQILKDDYDYQFPESLEGLKSLPGIGDYTAAAICAIAFNKQASVMDGNIERVLSRLFQIEDKLPKAKRIFKDYADYISADPLGRHGDFAQAMMDLGATICTPKQPKCLLCPVREFCVAGPKGNAEAYPKKEAKKKKPKRYAKAIVIFNETDNAVLMRKRPTSGLLANLYEVPTTPWLDAKKDLKGQGYGRDELNRLDVKKGVGAVKHSFTHFDFFIDVFSYSGMLALSDDEIWVPLNRFEDFGIPTLMKKIIYHALKSDEA